jgi:ATP-dependent Zn protease
MRKPKRISQLTKTAYHEAGHAVVALRLRQPVKRVSILPDETGLGRVTFSGFQKLIEAVNNGDDGPREERRAQRIIMLVFAGHLATEKLCGRSMALRQAGAHGDYSKAYQLAHAFRSFETADDWTTSLSEETRRLLDRYWPAVKALAKALLKRNAITGREAQQICQRSMGAPFRRKARRRPSQLKLPRKTPQLKRRSRPSTPARRLIFPPLESPE